MASIKKRTTAAGEARYDVRVRITGRAVTRTFTRRKDADAYVTQIAHDRLRGVAIDPRAGRVRFDRYADWWLRSGPAKRPSSQARNESVVRVHLVPAIGDRPLSDVAPADVQGMVNAWAKRYAPATVGRHYTTLQAIFSAAVSEDRLARSPCRGVKLPSNDRPARPIIGPEDVQRLADATAPAYAPMVYLGAVLGLRWGECAGLRVGNVDLLRRRLTVEAQRTRGLGGRMVEGPPKSAAGRRSLAVPAALIELLADHLARAGLTASDTDAHVFTGPTGAPLEYNGWRRRAWYPALAAAGLEGLTFHDLRHVAATALVAERVDVRTAQTRLGHSSPTVTLGVYAQVTAEADQAAADALGARFMPRRRGPRDGRAMELTSDGSHRALYPR